MSGALRWRHEEYKANEGTERPAVKSEGVATGRIYIKKTRDEVEPILCAPPGAHITDPLKIGPDFLPGMTEPFQADIYPPGYKKFLS